MQKMSTQNPTPTWPKDKPELVKFFDGNHFRIIVSNLRSPPPDMTVDPYMTQEEMPPFWVKMSMTKMDKAQSTSLHRVQATRAPYQNCKFTYVLFNKTYQNEPYCPEWPLPQGKTWKSTTMWPTTKSEYSTEIAGVTKMRDSMSKQLAAWNKETLSLKKGETVKSAPCLCVKLWGHNWELAVEGGGKGIQIQQGENWIPFEDVLCTYRIDAALSFDHVLKVPFVAVPEAKRAREQSEEVEEVEKQNTFPIQIGIIPLNTPVTFKYSPTSDRIEIYRL